MTSSGCSLGVTMLILAAIGTPACMPLAAAGAGGLLHPARHRMDRAAPDGCETRTFDGADVVLKGWWCRASAARKATLVYLHGIADNRTSAAGIVARFRSRGFDVIAYDSRAHGESTGAACTYGFFEKQDLRRVLDTVAPGPIVLLGTSLGAAVALQEAAEDTRVSAVVAAETFSDLRTVAVERAPFFFTRHITQMAFRRAEEEGHFSVDAVSPAAAAPRISAPVLLIHGADDHETSPAHSAKVYAALKAPKRLILVPGAGHNDSLRPWVWPEIERWIDDAIARW